MTDFFTIDDALRYAGDAAGEIYESAYREMYKEIRQEGKDEVVGFEEGILLEKELDVKGEKYGDKFVEFGEDVFHFLYSSQDVGIQNVIVLSPSNCEASVERITFSKRLNKNYMPRVNRILFYTDNTGIFLQCLGNSRVDRIKVFYVPKPSKNMECPDGIVQMVITKTVGMLKEMSKGVIIKKDIDNNQNKVMESEINKQALKP
jgi:hypothetical protein